VTGDLNEDGEEKIYMTCEAAITPQDVRLRSGDVTKISWTTKHLAAAGKSSDSNSTSEKWYL